MENSSTEAVQAPAGRIGARLASRLGFMPKQPWRGLFFLPILQGHCVMEGPDRH